MAVDIKRMTDRSQRVGAVADQSGMMLPLRLFYSDDASQTCIIMGLIADYKCVRVIDR